MEFARINSPLLKGENRPFVYICTEMCIWDVVALCWMWTCLVNGKIEKVLCLYICINLYIHVCICVCIDKAIYIYFPKMCVCNRLTAFAKQDYASVGILGYSASQWKWPQCRAHHQACWHGNPLDYSHDYRLVLTNQSLNSSFSDFC